MSVFLSVAASLSVPRPRARRRPPRHRPPGGIAVFNTLMYVSLTTIALAAAVHAWVGFPRPLTLPAALLTLAPHVWWTGLVAPAAARRGRRLPVLDALLNISGITICIAASVHWLVGVPRELTVPAALLALMAHAWWLSLRRRIRR